MNKDEYGEVINGPETFAQIAIRLKIDKRVLVGWTDQLGTHFDILFVNGTPVEGANIQGGLRENDLFVSIMRVEAFGFEADKFDTFAGYYAEKLFVSGRTADELSILINEVKKLL